MIRYLCSKVNLWEGKYFFFMMEDKMIYQTGCLENTPKKRGQATFSGRKARKREKVDSPLFCTRTVHAEKVDSPLF